MRVVAGYPAAALDMIYLHPPLQRSDGQAIPAVSTCLLDGTTYQQWSRHYTPANPWRIGFDDVTVICGQRRNGCAVRRGKR